MNTKLRNVIPEGYLFEAAFSKHYALNDAGHRREHFVEVEKLAKEINEAFGLGWDSGLITAVAWLHDMFAWSRENHHLLSGMWVRTTDHYLIRFLSPDEREFVALACEEHRASYTGKFSSTLSELMSSADRGYCLDVKDNIRRACIYSATNLGLTKREGMMRAVGHQQEKFGRNGYGRFPQMYLDYFATEMEERYKLIDELNEMDYEELEQYIAV